MDYKEEGTRRGMKRRGMERVKHMGGTPGGKQTCTHTHKQTNKQNMEILGSMNK